MTGGGAGEQAVDLRSDTVTRPTPAMREAVAGAEVGDDVLEKDPTVDRLEERISAILGTEAALFFPSGTQANQTAVAVHTEPGDEVAIEERAHVFHYEHAAPAALSGVQLRSFASDRGKVGRRDYEPVLRPGDRHHPCTGLLWAENSHNDHGGVVAPLEGLREVGDLGTERGVPVHLDGARLWNAAVASGTAMSSFVACGDTVMVSLSKGLGCPVGSLLAGPAETMERAWVVRKRLGGGMRQSGLLAAAGLHALDRGPDPLAEDHRRARELAQGADGIPGLAAPEPETNIVMIHLEESAPEPADLAEAAGGEGAMVLPAGPRRLRAVTHRDLNDGDVERAVRALDRAVATCR